MFNINELILQTQKYLFVPSLNKQAVYGSVRHI